MASNNQNNALLLQRARQSAAIANNLRNEGSLAAARAEKVDAELARPFRAQLPALVALAGPAGQPSAITARSLADSMRQREDVRRDIREWEDKLARHTDRMEAELAAAPDFLDIEGEASPGAAQAIQKAYSIARAAGEESLGPSSDDDDDKGASTRNVVRDTPESLIEERTEYAGNLRRIAELETEVKGLREEKVGLVESTAKYKEVANKCLGDLDRVARRVEIVTTEKDSHRRRVDELETRVLALTTEANKTREDLQESRQTDERLREELAAREATIEELINRASDDLEKQCSLVDKVQEQEEEMLALRASVAEATSHADAQSELAQERLGQIHALEADRTTLQEQLQSMTGEAASLQLRVDALETAVKDGDGKLAAENDEAASLARRVWELSEELQTKMQALDATRIEAESLSAELHTSALALEAREAEVGRLSVQLQTGNLALEAQRAEADGLSGELQVRTAVADKLRGVIIAVCTQLLDMDADQVSAICLGAWELARLTAVPPSTALWSVGQSANETACTKLGLHGLPLLCMFLTARLRTGLWDNVAIVAIGMIIAELEVAADVPVKGLLMVLSAAVDGAPEHVNHVLLLAVWQLAVRLAEIFPTEPRFGLQRDVLDHQLEDSPWYHAVAQAIMADRVGALCEGDNGKLFQEQELGVFVGPRDRFVAFNMRERRLWVFADANVRLCVLPTYADGLVIPGTDVAVPCLHGWWIKVSLASSRSS